MDREDRDIAVLYGCRVLGLGELGRDELVNQAVKNMKAEVERISFEEEYYKAWQPENNPEGYIRGVDLGKGEKNSPWREPMRDELVEYLKEDLDFTIKAVDWARGEDMTAKTTIDVSEITQMAQRFREELEIGAIKVTESLNEELDQLREIQERVNSSLGIPVEFMKSHIESLRVHPIVIDSLAELQSSVRVYNRQNRATRRGQELEGKSSRFTSEVCPRGAKNTIRRRSKKK